MRLIETNNEEALMTQTSVVFHLASVVFKLLLLVLAPVLVSQLHHCQRVMRQPQKVGHQALPFHQLINA